MYIARTTIHGGWNNCRSTKNSPLHCGRVVELWPSQAKMPFPEQHPAELGDDTCVFFEWVRWEYSIDCIDVFARCEWTKTDRPHISWSLDWFEDETTSKGLRFLVAELNTWNSGSNLGLARYQLHCPSMQWTKLICSQKTSRFEVGYATLCMSRCVKHCKLSSTCSTVCLFKTDS